MKDFAPIARLGTTSFMLMVRPDFPAKNFKEFLAHAKANPGKLSAGYGSAGSQVSQAMLRSMGKIDFVDVPYKGLPAGDHRRAWAAQISFTFADLANALAQIEGRQAARPRRHLGEALAARAGRAGHRRGAAGLRADRLVRADGARRHAARRSCSELHDVTVKALAKPEVEEKFAALGTDVGADEPGSSSAGFIKSEIANWARLVKLAGIQPE